MRKLFAFFALFLLASCNEAGVEEQSAVETNYEFYAYAPGYDADSRTYVDENYGLHWINDDRITIFHGMLEPLQFAFMGATGSKSGKYYNVDGIFYAPDPDAPNNVAIYPYSANHVLDETTRAVTLEMPAVQNYTENSFGQNANTMVAITSDVFDTALYFKNVGSYLNVRLWGANQTVKSITITATGGEALSGAAKVTPVYGGDPTCEMLAEGSSPSVKLVCAEPIVVNTTSDQPVSFWMVLPPVTMASGLTATVENAEGQTQIFEITKSVTFARNKYNTLTREMTIEDISGKQIIYTSTDGEVVTPADATAFNATIVSNTYENGKGVILFEEDVTTIGAGAFKGCATLEDITIPEGVTEIGDEAFKECSSLQQFEGKVATTDGHCLIVDGVLQAFARVGVTEYVIPEGVTAIGVAAFWGCDDLERITFPSTLTSIRGNAFGKCTKLETIAIPESVTSIVDNPFRGCALLSQFTGKFASQDGRCLMIGDKLISVAVAELTEFAIPESVATLGYMAFGYADKLTAMTIPESVTYIGGDAFYGCTSLAEVTIPASVNRIDYGAFQGCTKLTAVYCEPTNPPAGSDMMFAENATDRMIYVPAETVADYKAAYGWSTYADSIVAKANTNKPANNEIWYTTNNGNGIYTGFPSFSVKHLSTTYNEEKACWVATFDGPITTIGQDAFVSKTNLTTVFLPDSATSIESSAFSGCSALVSVDFPVNLKKIGSFAFSSCTSLVDVKIPDTVELIDQGAFDSCSGLQYVVVGNSVTTIEAYAFYGTSNLQSIVLGSQVETIATQAFTNSGLTSITLPESVKKLGDNVFMSCKSLQEVYCMPTTPPSCGSGVFSNPSSKLVIYVPSNAYLTATNWSSWADRMRFF